ncbi:hypothetical protein HMPREF0673_01274 [Leyella stercorea DSM 18206]|uniref:Uncharacterized protein n=1 Tax=Leyella stercorea DSM 18206 TaxID=1002367 RepID=G6AXB9_9BACT|nr:hypothetical protein HMPREF0673_01274 [Leyella stercorea DSM 18206]
MTLIILCYCYVLCKITNLLSAQCVNLRFFFALFPQIVLPLQRYIMINSNVMSQIDIFEATSCKPEYVAAVNRLLLQLCSSPCEMSAELLQNLVNEPNSRKERKTTIL